MRKTGFYILIVVVIFLLLAGATLGMAVYVPYLRAETRFPAGEKLQLSSDNTGAINFVWPMATRAQRYLMQIRDENAPEGSQLLFSEYFTDTQCRLNGFPEDRELSVEIRAERDYRALGVKKTRQSGSSISAQLPLRVPEASELVILADYRDKSIQLDWNVEAGDLSRIYFSDTPDGDYSLLAELNDDSLKLNLGEPGALPLPEFGTNYYFWVRAFRENDEYVFDGNTSNAVSVQREDLLSRKLNLQTTELGNNIYTFTWDETPGSFYELQTMSGGVWETVYTCGQGEERSYTTPRLRSCSEFSYRLRVVGGEADEDGAYPVAPESCDLSTPCSALYATIWPLQKLNVYAAADLQSAPIGEMQPMTMLCVLDEENGMFRVRIAEDSYGYIDSRYCLINLPEYLGDLCAYSITNSYESLYMVHEFEIPDVTGTIIKGYEDVFLRSGQQLVPLLYPVAQRLYQAGLSAAAAGYRLKIYDAFRPNMATRDIYDITASYLESPLPEATYAGERVFFEEDITYADYLHDDTYVLSNFLARSASLHNIGIALDLTIERMDSGEELEMQTRMHDLSIFSVRSRNNASANLLSGFMTGAGFATLSSEWWHFQDNEIRSKLTLATQYYGVSCKGWISDGTDWYYRLANGNLAADTTLNVDGTDYSFDRDGRMIP